MSNKKIFKSKKFKNENKSEKISKEDLSFTDAQLREIIDNLDKDINETISVKNDSASNRKEDNKVDNISKIKTDEIKTDSSANTNPATAPLEATPGEAIKTEEKPQNFSNKFKRIKHRRNKKSKKNTDDSNHI